MARTLAKSKIQKAIREAVGQDPDPVVLDPGHMRLYSVWRPSLTPGLYGIEATQAITSNISGTKTTINVFNYQSSSATGNSADTGDPKADVVLQEFNVIAPQFSIDPKVVNSIYPPPGHLDEGVILPHIVFNDPHLPWDRTLVLDVDEVFPDPVVPPLPTQGPSIPRIKLAVGDLSPNPRLPAASLEAVNRQSARRPPGLPPWMALVVFDPTELQLTSAEETALGIPIPAPPIVPNTTPQPQQPVPNAGQIATPNAYPMMVKDYLTKITSRVNYEAGFGAPQDQPELAALKNSQDPTTIIFPQKSLVDTIFNPIYQFMLMSHARKINTTGLPEAGVDEENMYSMCISKRSGITSYPATDSTPKPMTQIVHLVSLEYIHQTNLTTNPSDRIGLVSLYSWTYLSVPPNPANFLTTMTNLADGLQMLTTSNNQLNQLSSSIATQTTPDLQKAAQHLYDHLSRGYTISRWRTAVGQETVAYTRGPLTPLPTPWKPSVANDWPGSSNTGKDYQILDQDLGVMDVSYSAAWQLGKLMAISDNNFNKALFRFRSLVHEAAASVTRKEINGVLSKTAVLKNIPAAVDGLKAATDGTRTPVRLNLPGSGTVAPPLSDPQVSPVFTRNLIKIIDAQTAAGEKIYSDYNLGQANNSDWEVIHNWISDKLFLGGIPAQYLIPDPSMLPSEALRFFYIDSAWMDCFIDGALSVGNHLEPIDDKVRRRIKDVYNVYLRNNIDPAPVKPPVPEYGFILRSSLIQVMPDIRITVTCRSATAPNTPDPTRQPLVRLAKMDDFTIMALVNCLPEEIFEIVIAQPPHQQRYIAAAKLDQSASSPEYFIRQLYTSNAPTGEWTKLDATLFPYPVKTEMEKWYDYGSRCINVLQMAVDLNALLNETPDFDSSLDSAVFSLQLSDFNYQLKILPPVVGNPLPAAQDRQLWVGTDVADSDDPIQPALPVLVPTPTPPIIVPPGPLVSPSSKRVQTRAISGSSAAKTGPTPSPIQVHVGSSTTSETVKPPKPLVLSVQPVAKTRLRAPDSVTASSSLTSQFSLAVYPDYRGPPPLPFTAADGTVTYSSKDFIPTTTTHLFDLIFSLQHQPPTPPIPFPLLSLSLSIPTDTSENTSHEPLLSGTYAGDGAYMLSNLRLIAFLTASPGFLHIELKPRSALPGSASPESIPAVEMSDASFRLLACPIASIVNAKTLKVIGGAGAAVRSLCKVKVVETYLMSGNVEGKVSNVWDIVKRDGGDVHLNGNPV
jgi:hypothetical protein